MKYIKELYESDWGSSDQSIMMNAMHKDLGEPKEAPGLPEVLSVAEESVDFYWDEWDEYKTTEGRKNLIDSATRSYYLRFFKDWYEGMKKMFEPKK